MKVKILFLVVLTIAVAAVVRGGIIQLSPGIHISKVEEDVSIEHSRFIVESKTGIFLRNHTKLIQDSISDFFDFCQQEKIEASTAMSTHCNAAANNVEREGLAVIEELNGYEMEKQRHPRFAVKPFAIGVAKFTTNAATALGTVYLTYEINQLKEDSEKKNRRLDNIEKALRNHNISIDSTAAQQELEVKRTIDDHLSEVLTIFTKILEIIDAAVSKKPLEMEDMEKFIQKKNQAKENAAPELKVFKESKVFVNKNDEIVVHYKISTRLTDKFTLYNITLIPHNCADNVKKCVIAANKNNSTFFSPTNRKG
jgi:hypothetical protein